MTAVFGVTSGEKLPGMAGMTGVTDLTGGAPGGSAGLIGVFGVIGVTFVTGVAGLTCGIEAGAADWSTDTTSGLGVVGLSISTVAGGSLPSWKNLHALPSSPPVASKKYPNFGHACNSSQNLIFSGSG